GLSNLRRSSDDQAMVLSSSVRLWLLPNAVLLAVLAIWGAIRYPHLPGRIPKHIGLDGVDAWADKSVGSALGLVFVYAGVTLLMVGSAELTLRVTPRDELTNPDAAPYAVTPAASSSLNRPASRASARRIARALLQLNTCIGISFSAGCWMLWRSTPDADEPTWVFAAMLLPFLVGGAVTLAACIADRRQ
ncbi:DUF1648 domain-containing protein, partial [Streptomyces sp. NPDC048224]|uniref:DUF1648 domain-containing protein n=1 Tax=Streptomyces sp. NPDC048224 TaxID=3154500 RepID=UPI0033EBCBFB